MIFAGSPEWMNMMVSDLTKSLINYPQIPIMYLGIGSFEEIKDVRFDSIAPNDQTLLKRARYITTRDENTQKKIMNGFVIYGGFE